MYTILLDSSNSLLTVGIAKDKTLLEAISFEAWQRQSEEMIPVLDKLMNNHGVDISNISNVAVAIGPGSYTGVRIALTVAKTIATVLPVKLYAISSLRVLRKGSLPSICLSNARSNRSYVGVYEGETEILADSIMNNDEVKQYIIDHPDYVVCGDTKYLGINGYQSDIAAEMLALIDVTEPMENPLALKPIYLKD